MGDYQRQFILMDHAGLPLKTVLEKLDLLGEHVVPVLRKELESLRPADVPAYAPSHSELVAAGDSSPNAQVTPSRTMHDKSVNHQQSKGA